MKIVKNKNLICFIINPADANKFYSLDINSGTLYGLRNKPIKIFPERYRNHLYGYNEENGLTLNYAVTCIREKIPLKVEVLTFFDKIESLNDDSLSILTSRLASSTIQKLTSWKFKDAVAFLKTFNNLSVTSTIVAQAVDVKEWKDKYGFTNLSYHEFYRYLLELSPASSLEISLLEYYLNVQQLRSLGLTNVIINYFKQCRDLKVEPRKNNDPIREFTETNKRWEAWKNAKETESFFENYNKHSKAWEFQYDNFIVQIPTCGQDLIAEGAKMHNCVGSYVNRVANNQTYICFIRHKDNPNRPHITCQVYLNGTIGQYHLSCNKQISSKEDKAFKKAYQNYLNSVWNE